ncbi:MAG: protein kinase, partial [Chloroflexi bacterium]|nr:protein kinase [Chloroflexota bacterium]
LHRNGPPDAPTAISIMRQVASALQAAGEAGIVHRDIKPENILINRKGEAKVTDFGLAQLSQTSEGVNLTQVGVTMGTPLYMSPEQVNGKKLDHRSDIYSFGVTCYHMLAGQPPFHGETAMSVAVQHVNNEPQPLRERRSDLPPALCQLVHKMMAKEPDDRYPNAQTVLEDLRKIAKALQEQPDGAADLSLSQFGMPTISPAKTTAALGTRFLQWCRSHQTTAFVLTAFFVGTVAAGIGWTMRPADPFKFPSEGNNTTNAITKRDTAGEQYSAAIIDVDNEASWRAVMDYFPDDTIYTPKAMIPLAFLLLDDGRYNILLQRLCRARIVEEVWTGPYRTAMLEPFETDPPMEIDLDPCREQIEELLADPPLRQWAQVGSVRNLLTHEIPTAVMLDLAVMALCRCAEERYAMLAEPCPCERAEWLRQMLVRTRQMLGRAQRQGACLSKDGLALN